MANRNFWIFFFSTTFIYVNSYAKAKDNTKSHFFIDSVSLDVSSKFSFHGQIGREEFIPSYFLSSRESAASASIYTLKTLANTPFSHGTFYSRFSADVFVLNFINFYSSLVVEHRGFSYGITNQDMIKLLPQLRLDIDTSFSVNNEKFLVSLSIGYFEDVLLHERLFFYNMDVQGCFAYLKWKYFKFLFSIQGDYFQWIGLNNGDVVDISLVTEKIPISDNAFLNFHVGVYAILNSQYLFYSQRHFRRNSFLGNFSLDGLFYSASASFDYKNFSFYGEYALRHSLTPIHISNLSAFVVGSTWKYITENIEIFARLEYRYYGWGANAGFKDTKVTYTSPEGSNNSSITYPLSWYQRPFSQWAVYTDYQGRNVFSLAAYFKGVFRFAEHFFLRTVIDVNLIGASFLPAFVYPFFTLGISWRPLPLFQLEVFSSNIELNSYRHFPTLSLKRYPIIGISLSFDLQHTIIPQE